MIFSYSLSLPLESFHRLNITDASTLAGLYVLGSFSKLTTESKMVLKKKNMTDFSITFSYIKLFKIGNILPNVLCGIPSLTGKLSAMRIIYGWMENRNAQITVLQNKAMNKHLITNAPDALTII